MQIICWAMLGPTWKPTVSLDDRGQDEYRVNHTRKKLALPRCANVYAIRATFPSTLRCAGFEQFNGYVRTNTIEVTRPNKK